MRNVDDGRERRCQSTEHVNQAHAVAHGDSGIASALRRKADGVERSSDYRAAQQQVVKRDGCCQDDQLRRDYSEDVALAQVEEAGGEVREVVDAAGDAFSESAEQRVRSEGYD